MTSDTALILYGPPAAGKDTVTAALPAPYMLYRRLKVGPGRTTGYRMGTVDDLAALHANGQVIYENRRYGSVYVVDAPEFDLMLTDGLVPVLHLGQPEAVSTVIAVRPDVHWIVVELWCSREIAAQRLDARGTDDMDARLDAWDDTQHLAGADLRIDTSEILPADAARQILQVGAA
ncbi:kinase [Nocardia mangyaensis]|uniref:kinase n=1 Tax=Nocardia mangyaensis TaxID=2213200 RepID=UPI002674A1CD|nr:kinase [Nocardia mangyaensis]MDO3651174.1 kinase [Nocardia mangyaensis]